VKSGVRADEDVRIEIREHLFEKGDRRRGLPEEFVDLAGRAVDEQDLPSGDLEAPRLRKVPHPSLPPGGGLPCRVVVRDLREVIVPRVRVTAVAVLGSGRE